MSSAPLLGWAGQTSIPLGLSLGIACSWGIWAGEKAAGGSHITSVAPETSPCTGVDEHPRLSLPEPPHEDGNTDAKQCPL